MKYEMSRIINSNLDAFARQEEFYSSDEQLTICNSFEI